jgi:hypothetical protein
MENSQEKKKNFIGTWLDRLLQPRSLYEFETPLTPYQCYERLQKLSGKMAYLKAKSKVELANAGDIPAFELQWKPQENVCEFVQLASQTRNSSAGLRGKVFFSDIYERTQVYIRPRNPSNRKPSIGGCIGVSLLLVAAYVLCSTAFMGIQDAVNFFLRTMLPIGLCFSPVVIFAFALAISRSRDNLKLLRIVLTEPDESQL